MIACGQERWLRVVRRQVHERVFMVAGYDICDGDVVREPNGAVPKFIGKEVPGCLDDLPVMYERADAERKQSVEFELVFSVPADLNPLALSDTVGRAGYTDAVIGIGRPGVLVVALDVPVLDYLRALEKAKGAILKEMPAGASVLEVKLTTNDKA